MKEEEKRVVSCVLSLHNPSFLLPHICSQCSLSCLLFVLGSAGSAWILTSSKKIDNLVSHLSKGSTLQCRRFTTLGTSAEPRALLAQNLPSALLLH